ncbi:elongation factor G [Cyanobacterium aponinum]|uniref:Translation elongation factor 2 (EF-2/EF-G) n=1 Tax=Cyanobacterium aponinum (strain PCC 10605) TaxID=755178 RepID=K9Z4E8_CYAAP|nr:elongation factor G [Cyanobacterium aponinum]AFZ54014.1 translation elongation factor 2 (EF-2/EF-G) [Cyanobacterium aponinum PCC 10605]
MNDRVETPARNVAIVGPYSSGKTTLLESLLFVSGAINRKGRVEDGNTIGDNSIEAKNRQMSVEVSSGYTEYEDINFTFLDCPGSVEFMQETYNALVGAGTAVVVCEPSVSRVLTLAPLFKFLDDWQIPHLVYINKMDRSQDDFMDVLNAIKDVSSRPLVPQQYPIKQDHDIIGYIDLITEQAYHYHQGDKADLVPFPENLKELETQARQEMLETLADFDDHLLEELIEDIEPSKEEILKDLKQDLSADLIVPVFFGMAKEDYGVRPLLDCLIKEAPSPNITAERRGLKTVAHSPVIAQVLKTYYSPQGGRLSLVRVWQGKITDGMTLNGVRVGGIYRLMGGQQKSQNIAQVGEIVALARLEGIKTGDTLTDSEKEIKPLPKANLIPPVYAQAVTAEHRRDEVKISGAIAKILEEDPSLKWEQDENTHEVILWGQGAIHLQVTLERLSNKYNLSMVAQNPKIPYKETIRKSTQVHGRYKHQSGGHGAFGDVYLDIKPLARGEGFQFHETIVGGVVPKQYIPGVETGVREYLQQGPLGYPVVDVDVTLTDGSYHSVDSSEQAFKQAARIAMTEGIVQCDPILLEPVLLVDIFTPNEFTSKVLQLVSAHRGQILGYEGVRDWKNWDQVNAYLPQGEMQDFIIELRSLSLGVGFFNWQYDHLEIVPDKVSHQVLAA